MMAMTIFMGSTPAWARPAGAGLWAVSLAHSRAKPRFAGNAAATNQAPCQFAPPAVSAWKRWRVAAGLLRPFAKRRTNPGHACSIFNQRCQGRARLKLAVPAQIGDRRPRIKIATLGFFRSEKAEFA